MEKIKIKAIAGNIFQLAEGKDYDAVVVDGVTYIAAYGTTTTGSASKKSSKEDKDEAPAKSSKTKPVTEETEGDDAWDAVSAVLEAFDKGTIQVKKATERLVATELVDEAAAKKIITKMDKDSDFTLAQAIKELKAAAKGGDEEEEEAPKSPKKRGGGKKEEAEEDEDAPFEDQPKGKVIADFADLAVGDKVSVYWDTDDEDTAGWWKGEVEAKLRGGKWNIKYEEDDSEEVLNPEVHTRVVKLK